MNALSNAECIKDAKREIEYRYQQGELTKEERDYQLNHILGF